MIPGVIDTTQASMPEEWKREGWIVERHCSLGAAFVFDPERVTEFLSDEQQGGGCIRGLRYRELLEDKQPLPDAVLDHLLIFTEKIPQAWDDGNQRFFFGTTYCSPYDNLCVRSILKENGVWRWRFRFLVRHWYPINLALVLVR